MTGGNEANYMHLATYTKQGHQYIGYGEGHIIYSYIGQWPTFFMVICKYNLPAHFLYMLCVIDQPEDVLIIYGLSCIAH